MTAINYHFNSSYNSNGLKALYTKIAVELTEKNGMFCVIINKANRNETHQKFTGINRRHFVGKNEVGYCNGFGALKSEWNRLSETDKYLFRKACYGLPQSFLKYLKSNGEAFTATERDDVFASIATLCNELDTLVATTTTIAEITTATAEPVATSTVTSGIPTTTTSGAVMTTPTETTVEPTGATAAVADNDNPDTWENDNPDTWETVRLHGMLTSDLNAIIDKVNNAGINGEITHEGNVYRVVGGDSKSFALQRKVAVKDTTPVTTPQSKLRKKVKMAYLTDNDSLTEFVNGCFYKFVRSETIDGEQYAIVLNDKGEERKLSSKRVNVIDTFDAPPNEEKEKEAAMA